MLREAVEAEQPARHRSKKARKKRRWQSESDKESLEASLSIAAVDSRRAGAGSELARIEQGGVPAAASPKR
jgi:hypothetical protein